MPQGKICGNCQHFTRIKNHLFQQGGRNGICDIFDYNCHSDSAYAKKCLKYKKLRFDNHNKNNIIQP